MKLDTFIQLIADLRKNQLDGDEDPANILLETYTSPYDVISLTESVRVRKTTLTSLVWGDGTTYTSYDVNNNAYQAPSCGWVWGAGGRWQ